MAERLLTLLARVCLVTSLGAYAYLHVEGKRWRAENAQAREQLREKMEASDAITYQMADAIRRGASRDAVIAMERELRHAYQLKYYERQ